jgi:class 3 adenylate cyclase/tetratricopeptide (TPR) repeat protein
MNSEFIACHACAADNAVSARFCGQCGAALAAAADQPAKLAAATAQAERKQVTVLFADLTGFTAITEKLDPEETRQIMGRVFQLAAGIVARYDGRIEKFIGDAIMALFGVPDAHEDDPQRAVRAALELHQAVAQLSPEIEARTGVAIALHSGVNTGIVVTGELKIDHGTAGPLGDTINTAARLMNAAPSGQLWIGPETRRLVALHFDIEELGAHDFKGKAQPLAVARVRGLRGSAAPAPAHAFRGAFVGRQAELGALLGAAEKMRDGQPQVLGVCGDAGTGKTRLVNEFRAKLGADAQWLEGRAYAYARDIPYSPLIDLLSRVLHIEETDHPAQLRAKLEAGVRTLPGADDDALPLFLHLYHLEQASGVVIEREAFQDRLLVMMRRVLTALAAQRPTVVCLQDLHWADPSTVTQVAGLVAGLASSVLLLVNYRPGYTPPPGMQVLNLQELSPRQTGELLASLLQGEPPAPLVGFITERSDGNPFYVEEVVNALVETGVLARQGERWVLARPLAEAAVPATIRGVIAARIDRLDEARRRLLRLASVVGREFVVTIIALVGEYADDITPGLAQLQAADLIRQRRLEPELEYMFKHALTQDVAYEGLLKAERQRLHARTAQAMEGVFAERIPEVVETLAYHYQRGGVPDKALHYLTLAGRKCVDRFALDEAERHYREAYALLPGGERTAEQSRSVAQLLVAWSQLHYYRGSFGELHALLQRHQVEAERCADKALLALYLGWLGFACGFAGNFQEALDLLDRALDLGRLAQAREAVALVTAWRVFSLFESGRSPEAIHAAESLDWSTDERRHNPYPYFKCRAGLAMALLTLGDHRRACEVAQELIAFGLATGNARAQSLGHWCMAFFWSAADPERCVEGARAAMDAAKDPFYKSMNANPLASALMVEGRFAEVLDLCRQWLSYFETNANRSQAAYLRAYFHAARIADGDLSEGLRGLLAGIADTKARQQLLGVTAGELTHMIVLVLVACKGARPRLGVLARNPWFVFTQVPFAAGKAAALIEHLRIELPRRHQSGYLPYVDLYEALLCVAQGKSARARECLQCYRQYLHNAGIVQVPAPVAKIEAEIAARR